MRSTLTRLSAAAAALALFAAGLPAASAEIVNLTLNNSGTSVTYDPYGSADGKGPVTVGAGAFHWTQSGVINTSVTTYCIDLDHYISKGGTYQYNKTTDLTQAPTIGNNSAKIAAISELFDHYYNSSLTSSANQSAFQLALWELVYDGASSKSLTAGRIEASNTQAQSMLDSLGKPYSNHDLNGYQLVAYVSCDGHQDQIGITPKPPSGVPAPPALMLAGIGVLGLAGRARWTRKAAPTA